MIKSLTPIGLHWPTQAPFLFCAHHLDHFPAGNPALGVEARHLEDREMGADFAGKDGFRMYHGREIPGFPVHPHRGFETITIVRKGHADHADSMGAAGRYGEGDVQWMSAGSGVQHSEMFPLLHQDRENTLELFQIWLNLPKVNKMATPDFKMLWAENIPKIKKDKALVTLICGTFEESTYNEAPSVSWASDPRHEVNIMLVQLAPGGEFNFPAHAGVNRSLYFFASGGADINGEAVPAHHAALIEAEKALEVKSESGCEFLLLEGMPIGEPVVQYGPFVMNTKEEIANTIADYQRTQFGGWKWERKDMVHGPRPERFARYPDGRMEYPPKLD